MFLQTHSFVHHGRSFTIEAEGWPSDETAAAAIVDLQSWTLRLDAGDTAALHDVLSREREALVYGLDYDRQEKPLPAVRDAQRHAVRSGLGAERPDGNNPTVTLEASQVSKT